MQKVLASAMQAEKNYTMHQIFVTKNLWKITALQERRINDVYTNMDFRFKKRSKSTKTEIKELRKLASSMRIAKEEVSNIQLTRRST